ncbi:hypothetical protein RB623_17290 [Mesorhizobium sp. LHD-90]|uniref:hypothetical protein n=1 Tax=Mesorhizobium sp. LHD-90 TaxID=3071414 RepID=UPI0027E1D202|nr:hypothetical protein [Mesorhizobium sp. LHD-90]MDQ6435813.1 hypothetical protein [Mesorhizobium sp. LHD-90]
MTTTKPPNSKWPHALAAATLLAAALPAVAAFAQGTKSQEAVDAIIGSEVRQEETSAEAVPDKVVAAIEKTAESTKAVRTATKLDQVDIVFLTDSAKTEGGPPPAIESKVAEHRQEIEQLRDEIEGNAMLYHALDSRQVLVEDVLAVSFDKANVVIYAAAKPPR